MRIVDAVLTPYRLPFATPWRSAAGLWHERRGWLIRITDQSGRCGYGDAAPLPASGTETLSEAKPWLDAQLTTLIGAMPESACRQLPAGCPAARCGLETALLDLHSKQQALPLYRLLGGRDMHPVRINAAIGALDQQAGGRAVAAVAAGYSILKLKLGCSPIKTELSLLQRLCSQLPGEVRLRLDANRAWQLDEATNLIEKLNHLPIECLEEPLHEPTPQGLKALQSLARFDLALDESLPRYIRAQQLQPLPVKRIVVKPACLGGLVPALTLIGQAHQSAVACVITSCLESSAGLWPLCHLAATADAITTPAVHGLATGHWFSHNLGTPPVIANGRVTLGSEPGTGFILKA